MNRTGSRTGNGPYDDETEARLRASLSAKAGQAPNGDYLAAQIIAAAERGPDLATRPTHQSHGWRTWTLPLIAAGAVAAVVGTVVGVAHVSHDSASPGSTLTPPPIGGSPTGPRPTTSPTTHSSAVPSHGTTAAAANSVALHNFRAYDATFYGTKYGWAIGTANCVAGPGRCAAIVRMTNGTSWSSFHINSLFNVGPGEADVQHVRFATPTTGYAYGPDTFWTTTDGGKDWTQQSGGAYALETFNQNVIRVEADPGCPPGCAFSVWTADINGTSWTKSTLPGRVTGDAVQLVRAGSSAGLLVLQNPAGGANDERSTLYTSRDNGMTWTPHQEPCPQTGPSGAREVDSTAIAASDGGYALLCTPRQKPAKSFVVLTTGSGSTRTSGTIPADFASGEVTLAGSPTTVFAISGYGVAEDETTNGLELSFDGGKTWAPAKDVTGRVSFVGFESGTVGRAITNGGRTIWTTRNGGNSWSAFSFPD